MTELSRDARSLVARARVHEGPSAADRARIRAKLQPAWASSPPDISAAAGANRLAWWRRVPLAKLLVILAAASWSPSLASSPPTAASAVGAPQPLAAAESAAPLAAARAAEAPDTSHEEVEAPNERAEALAAAAATPVRASGQALDRRSARRAGVRVSNRTGASRRASPTEKKSADFVAGDATHPNENAGALGPARDAAQDAHTAEGARAVPSRVERSEPVRTTDRRQPVSLALTAPQDHKAPAQTGKEFKPQPIDDELAWIGAAQEALQNHRPSQALQLVEQHSFRFPDGALTQERLVVHTLALCALERFSAARRMLAVLEERAPDAPIVARVRSTCGL